MFTFALPNCLSFSMSLIRNYNYSADDRTNGLPHVYSVTKCLIFQAAIRRAQAAPSTASSSSSSSFRTSPTKPVAHIKPTVIKRDESETSKKSSGNSSPTPNHEGADFFAPSYTPSDISSAKKHKNSAKHVGSRQKLTRLH